jgi:hypothetical protein
MADGRPMDSQDICPRSPGVRGCIELEAGFVLLLRIPERDAA